MSLLVETIRIDSGRPQNLEFHNERFTRTTFELFGKLPDTSLRDIIDVPPEACSGIFKCRVEYENVIRKIEFIPYRRKTIRSLKIIERNDIEYRYKFTDRILLNELFGMRGNCDDILLIKDSLVTDTSYANVVFLSKGNRWFTPDSFLLPGTKRAALLKNGIITQARITISDIHKYSEARLINAMMDINDNEGIPVDRIIL